VLQYSPYDYALNCCISLSANQNDLHPSDCAKSDSTQYLCQGDLPHISPQVNTTHARLKVMVSRRNPARSRYLPITGLSESLTGTMSSCTLSLLLRNFTLPERGQLPPKTLLLRAQLRPHQTESCCRSIVCKHTIQSQMRQLGRGLQTQCSGLLPPILYLGF